MPESFRKSVLKKLGCLGRVIKHLQAVEPLYCTTWHHTENNPD